MFTCFLARVGAGQLVWRRFDPACIPSHRSVCATCVQLLPLIEMFCRWELQEDCSNLRELMLRFDSEAELATHDLGRSMLQMIDDDDFGMPIEPSHTQMSPADNPFRDIRSRLAAIGSAFQTLQPQVHAALGVIFLCSVSCRLWCHWVPQYSCQHTGLCPSHFNVNQYFSAHWFRCLFGVYSVAECFHNVCASHFFRKTLMFGFPRPASLSCCLVCLLPAHTYGAGQCKRWVSPFSRMLRFTILSVAS